MYMGLKNPNSSRVTYAAVFIPENKDEPVEYVLPIGIRRPVGFVEYDYDRHHKNKKLGKLCCGNCYSEGKTVEVAHRRPTAERIAGGEYRGHHATFSALPNTIDDHAQYCKDRRQSTEMAAEYSGIVLNINIPETYSNFNLPKVATHNHHIDHNDPRFEGRAPVAINKGIAEILRKITRFSRQQMQNALITIDGRVRSFRQGYIDGDGWQELLRELIIAGQDTRRAGGFIIPHRIFHVTNPTTQCRRAFNFASDAKPKEEKISCQQFEFEDNNGDLHIIQPSIHTKNDDVKALFEMRGEYLVIGNFRYISNEMKDGVIIHQIQIMVESDNLGVRLYNNPTRHIRDLEAMELLQRQFDHIATIDRKNVLVRSKKAQNVFSAQPDLFLG